MSNHDWDERYATDDLPWDTGEPDPNLVAFIERDGVPPGLVLEVGCGTGTNALWLASRDFNVIGVDISPRAVAKARAKAEAEQSRAMFEAIDFLSSDKFSAGHFDFVFDRGVFHVFDESEVRAQFARQVARALRPGGHWLSIAGSTEGPARDYGPPRRSARDIADAIEPALEILELRTTAFEAGQKAWQMLARVREVPAQPSTRRDG